MSYLSPNEDINNINNINQETIQQKEVVIQEEVIIQETIPETVVTADLINDFFKNISIIDNFKKPLFDTISKFDKDINLKNVFNEFLIEPINKENFNHLTNIIQFDLNLFKEVMISGEYKSDPNIKFIVEKIIDLYIIQTANDPIKINNLIFNEKYKDTGLQKLIMDLSFNDMSKLEYTNLTDAKYKSINGFELQTENLQKLVSIIDNKTITNKLDKIKNYNMYILQNDEFEKKIKKLNEEINLLENLRNATEENKGFIKSKNLTIFNLSQQIKFNNNNIDEIKKNNYFVKFQQFKKLIKNNDDITLFSNLYTFGSILYFLLRIYPLIIYTLLILNKFNIRDAQIRFVMLKYIQTQTIQYINYLTTILYSKDGANIDQNILITPFPNYSTPKSLNTLFEDIKVNMFIPYKIINLFDIPKSKLDDTKYLTKLITNTPQYTTEYFTQESNNNITNHNMNHQINHQINKKQLIKKFFMITLFLLFVAIILVKVSYKNHYE